MEARLETKSPRYDRKLAQILSTSARIFADEGYERASIRRVASELGISLSGLYYYFEGKEELLFRIQYHTFEALIDDLEAKQRGIEDPVEKLRILVHNHLEHFLAHINELKVCSFELESLTGDFDRKVRGLRRAYFQRLVAILEEIEAVKGDGSYDPRVAALALFGTLNWIYTWYDPKRYPSPQSLSDHLSDLFLYGFLSSNVKAKQDTPEG